MSESLPAHTLSRSLRKRREGRESVLQHCAPMGPKALYLQSSRCIPRYWSPPATPYISSGGYEHGIELLSCAHFYRWKECFVDPTHAIATTLLRLGFQPEWTMQRVLVATFKCGDMLGIDDRHTFDGFLSRYREWFRDGDGDGLWRGISFSAPVRLAPAELRELLVSLCDALMHHLGNPHDDAWARAASHATLGEGCN